MAFHPIGLLFSQPPTHGGCCSFSRPTYLAIISIRLLVLKARAVKAYAIVGIAPQGDAITSSVVGTKVVRPE